MDRITSADKNLWIFWTGLWENKWLKSVDWHYVSWLLKKQMNLTIFYMMKRWI